ncbi:MAG: ABC transporter ATP-binding protein [Flavobacteriales bacterium]|nr:ABC transporter ATP-binding protein [Flavobacteriales bacterium]
MRPLLKLNPYFAKYSGRLVLGTLFIALSNLFAVFSPQVVREAIDLIATGIEQGSLPMEQRSMGTPTLMAAWLGPLGVDLNALFEDLSTKGSIATAIAKSAMILGALYLAFALIKGVFLFFTRQTIIVMSRLIEYDLKNTIYRHYQQLDKAFYKRNSTGDLMNRISEDVSKVRMYLGPAVMYTLNLVVLFVLCIGFMISVNPELTLWTLLPLPIMSVVIYRVSDLINRKSMAVQQQQSWLSTLAQETFSGIRVVKAYAKEDTLIDRFGQAASEFRDRSLEQARVDAWFMPAIMGLIGISTVVTVFVGGSKLLAGDPTITVGNIAEFIIYVNMLTWPFASVGWVTSLVQQASASMERIDEFLSTRPTIISGDERPDRIEGHIRFREVSLRHPDTGILALDKVSFEVPAGKTLAIVGHTGSGKSTLAELILRLYDATEGVVEIDGKAIEGYDLDALRRCIGYVPQEVFLFSDTIRNNIAFAMDEVDESAVQRAARMANVHENVMEFPKGYATMLGERGVTLSGGQKQRVSIARALAADPAIIVLDDPLSAVDTATEEAILSDLRTHFEGRTKVIISHRISAVQDADIILVLEHGRLIASGTHGSLLGSNATYARLYQEQLLEEARS